MSRPLAVVVGVGPGVGLAVARAWAARGHDVAMVGRSEESLGRLVTELRDDGVASGVQVSSAAVDVADDPGLRSVVAGFGAAAGRVDVLHYNPSLTTMASPLTLTPEALVHDLRVGVAGLLSAVQAARPFLRPGGRVTATGSGVADQPWVEAASVGVQKAALRNLVTALDAALRPDGVRACSVTVRGVLGPGTPFDPAYVADALVAAAERADEEWTTEVAFHGRT